MLKSAKLRHSKESHAINQESLTSNLGAGI